MPPANRMLNRYAHTNYSGKAAGSVRYRPTQLAVNELLCGEQTMPGVVVFLIGFDWALHSFSA